MGSEAESMMQMTHYVHQPTTLATCPPDTFQDDLMAKMANLEQQLSNGLLNLADRVSKMDDRVEKIDDKVENLEQHVDRSLKCVRDETTLNIQSIHTSMQAWGSKLDAFFEKFGGMIVDRASSK